MSAVSHCEPLAAGLGLSGSPQPASSGPVLIWQDTFTGAAKDLESHTSETGGSYTESDDATGTSFDLNGTGLCVKASTGAGNHLARSDATAANVDISLVLGGTAAGTEGILFNWVDDANYWVAILGQSENQLEVYSVTADAANLEYQQAISIGFGDAMTIQVIADGDSLTVNFTDSGETTTHTFTYAGATPRAHKTGTGIGLYANDDGANFDSVIGYSI